MDKKQKYNLIENLLANRFNIETFKEFTANIINTRVRDRKLPEVVWKEYRDYIENYQVIGEYSDSNGEEINVIVVKIKEEKDKIISPIRARSKQRNFIAKFLHEYDKTGALVAFYNNSYPTWRLSFIKQELLFTSEGITNNLTPAKRSSFIVGEGEPNHTPISQFMNFGGKNKELELEELEEIFKLEKVTNEFFEAYKDKYLDLKKHLEEDEEFRNEALKHTKKIEEFSEEFSKKLMGQLAFLYFLQKKGWLGVKIVPQKILAIEFKDIYSKCSQEAKEIMDIAYKRESQDEYKLSVKIDELSNDKTNMLANCFKNSKFDEKWGNGEQKFIRTLFYKHLKINEKRREKGKKEYNFFNDYLEPLFYKALNEDRGDNQYYSKFNCKIPFLNGGLFEPYDNYSWGNTNFNIPDSIFSTKTEKLEGNGILDIFDRYNFTINENEPFETEVAVDPEMLGKVFENLLDVKDRISKGAFYTPREIVHYMCKESLINYLDNELKDVKREYIEQLLQMGEFTKEYDQHLFEIEYKNSNEDDKSNIKWGMPIELLRKTNHLDRALKNVKVADPAVGSGAFPLGMLNEIVKVRSILTEYMVMHQYFVFEKENKINEYWDYEDKLRKERSLYNLKLETIENCLYGVDIEPSAVEIAKLRLWLSIVVDSENDTINPLPNLDFNFMIGNSLLDEFEGIKLFNEKFLNKEYSIKNLSKIKTGFQLGMFGGIENIKEDIMGNIEKLHKKFFAEKNNEHKKLIKQEIERLEWQLIRVTLESSGNSDKIKKLEKLKKEKRKPYFLWKLEFSEVFKEKGGFDIVIGNPPYIPTEKIKNSDKSIYEKIFLSAYGRLNLYILFYEKGLNLLSKNGVLSFITPYTVLKNKYYIELRRLILSKFSLLEIVDFKNNKVFSDAVVDTIIMSIKNGTNKNKIKLISNIENFSSKDFMIDSVEPEAFLKNNDLSFDINNNNSLIDKVYCNTIPLKNIINFKQGIITGNNKKFLKEKEDNDYVKILKGKDFNRYSLKFNSTYLDYKEKLHRPRTPTIFEVSEKILLRQTGSYPIATIDYEKHYTLDSVHNGLLIDENFSLKYILSLLNSKLMRYIYEFKINEGGKVFAQVKIMYVNELPIKNKDVDMSKFEKYVDRIINDKKNKKNTNDLELEIDEMIYDLYELTEEEKEIVRNFKT